MPTVPNAFSQADLPNSQTTLYTVPGATRAGVTSVVFCNKTVTDVTVTVQIVRSGGSPILNVLSAAPVPGNQALELIQGKPIVLLTGDVLRAAASAITSVDVSGSVVENS